jgi:hypothetical protein
MALMADSDQEGVIPRSSDVGTWGKERRVHGREGERRARKKRKERVGVGMHSREVEDGEQCLLEKSSECKCQDSGLGEMESQKEMPLRRFCR